MKKRLLAWLLLMAMLLTVGAVAAAETNPNAGLGYYPGTSEKGWISVECSTMSKMNPFLQTYSTEFSINRHIWDCLVKLSPEDNSIVPAAAESCYFFAASRLPFVRKKGRVHSCMAGQ